jgi:hypothetical protein
MKKKKGIVGDDPSAPPTLQPTPTSKAHHTHRDKNEHGRDDEAEEHRCQSIDVAAARQEQIVYCPRLDG